MRPLQYPHQRTVLQDARQARALYPLQQKLQVLSEQLADALPKEGGNVHGTAQQLHQSESVSFRDTCLPAACIRS